MGMLDQVKQAMQMRKEAKRIQSEIEKITYEYANGGITAVVRGDFSLVLGGDALPRKKPDPMPMLHAAAALGAAPHETVAIGDSVNDALAARAAGMAVLAVPYGYNEGEPVDSADCDALVSDLPAAYRQALNDKTS